MIFYHTPPGAPGGLPDAPRGHHNAPRAPKSSKLAKRNRIAAKPRSHMWSKIRKENHQKLTFGEGVQPWDLARCPGRIESYRFIMESSKSKPYSASLKFMHARKLAVALSTSWPGGWGSTPPLLGRVSEGVIACGMGILEWLRT